MDNIKLKFLKLSYIASIMFIFCIFGCVPVGIYWEFFDNVPPFVVISMKNLTPRQYTTDPIRLQITYKKPRECKVTSQKMLIGDDATAMVYPNQNILNGAGALQDSNNPDQIITQDVTPFDFPKHLRPGRYIYRSIGTYRCNFIKTIQIELPPQIIDAVDPPNYKETNSSLENPIFSSSSEESSKTKLPNIPNILSPSIK